MPELLCNLVGANFVHYTLCFICQLNLKKCATKAWEKPQQSTLCHVFGPKQKRSLLVKSYSKGCFHLFPIHFILWHRIQRHLTLRQEIWAIWLQGLPKANNTNEEYRSWIQEPWQSSLRRQHITFFCFCFFPYYYYLLESSYNYRYVPKCWGDRHGVK